MTPSFNQAAFIAETIESVLGQDYPAVEYIVIDGGSIDGTVDILRRYGGRLRWVSERDDGQSDAIHRGFSEARGEVIAWLNADDVYNPGAIAAGVEALLSCPTASFVYGRVELVDRTGRSLGLQKHLPWDFDVLLNKTNYIPQAATFFRRDAYLAVGGLSLDLHYVMDYDLWIKLGRDHDVVAIDDCLARVRMYPETKTSSGGLARMDEMRRMVRIYGRTGIPDGHDYDLVRASVTGAMSEVQAGHYRRASRIARDAAPYVLRPTVAAAWLQAATARSRSVLAALRPGRTKPD